MGLPKHTKRIRISVNSDDIYWTYYINNVAIKYKEDPVRAEPVGDFNNDGSVNILDLIILNEHMANETGDLKFDLDGDDLIDAKDDCKRSRIVNACFSYSSMVCICS